MYENKLSFDRWYCGRRRSSALVISKIHTPKTTYSRMYDEKTFAVLLRGIVLNISLLATMSRTTSTNTTQEMIGS